VVMPLLPAACAHHLQSHTDLLTWGQHACQTKANSSRWCCRYAWAELPAYAKFQALGLQAMMAHYDLLSPMFPVQMLDLHKRLSRGEVHVYTRADSCRQLLGVM
jgi:hypothetical protein